MLDRGGRRTSFRLAVDVQLGLTPPKHERMRLPGRENRVRGWCAVYPMPIL